MQADQWAVELCVVSPMTRTMQTACLAFEHSSVPLLPWPVVTEFYTQVHHHHANNKKNINQDCC